MTCLASPKDIKLRIVKNVLSISAKRGNGKYWYVYYKHRPIQIDKKIPLPIPVSDDDELIAGTAKYQDGVVTLKSQFQILEIFQ